MNENTGKDIGSKLKNHFETLYSRVKNLENLVDNLIIANVILSVAVILALLKVFL